VGFANGSVTIIRGDLIHDRGARQRIVFESEEPITGLETQTGAVTTLYISTTSRILTLVIAGRGQGQPARVLEDTGCGLGCMTLDREGGDILIAREEAIFTYGPRGRGASYAFEGPKTSIDAFRDYVALVCPPKAAGTSKSDPLRKYTASPAEDIFGTTTFTLLDTDLKFIAHSEALVSPMKRIFMEWGDLFLLTTEGKVCGCCNVVLIFLLTRFRSSVIVKRHFSKSSKSYTSAIFTSLLLILRKRLGLIRYNRMPSTASMVTFCTREATMILLCSSISGPLIIRNLLRSFARLVRIGIRYFSLTNCCCSTWIPNVFTT
jgi:hypothetical protein